MTYSIVARDPVTGVLGVACQSHFFGAGSAVNWAEAGVGAVATQSFVNADYGGRGLEMMRAGQDAAASLAAILEVDPRPELRQVAMVDGQGRFAVHTGPGCVGHHGSRQGSWFSVQGNMLTGEEVLDAMAAAAEGPHDTVADALVAALRAAEGAGGDARGSQAAGIVVVGVERSRTPWNDVLVDLRVEDSPDPVAELARLVRRKRLFEDVIAVLFAEGLMIGPYREPETGATEAALDRLARAARELGRENLEAELWRSVLLARAGRRTEAEQALATIFSLNPELRGFVARLSEAGFLHA
ncbi:DUF1028 domain-containing protein [Pseudonocardia sp. H11422]|uniref:DUF1028 domain-containing protein n=1 Tax=Pseudonocardia sp. H11422 TaxID=2835866 RepID=UPI001BDD2149|nr:DUF1028 domain-containing protein [Pseudonocardia sp. H11422]